MCPKCKEPMVVFELEGIEIDHCVSCGGTWLDAGELVSITEAAGMASAELEVAMELVDDRLTHGADSHYRFLVADCDGRVAGYFQSAVGKRLGQGV